MRLEKNFPTWGRELRPIYNPFECGLDKFVKMEKNAFIGREQIIQLENQKLKRVSFEVEAKNADVMGDEPIWAKVPKGEHTKFISVSNGYGSKRFDYNGKDTPHIKGGNSSDGEWSVVGWITSGGFGHSVKKSLAQGYIPLSLYKEKEETFFQIEILGERCNATINDNPLFDPEGKLMRG